MATDRKLIDYLPPFMQKYREIAVLMDAEQPEVDRLWTAVENALADQFVMDATENGIARWEKVLDIFPKGTDTLDERKFRVIAMLNKDLPYTLKSLTQTLNNLCGADGYSIDVGEYKIEVKLAVANRSNYDEVEKILNIMIPANMVKLISIMYTRNDVLSQYTHEYLSAFTHEHIRSEVLQ